MSVSVVIWGDSFGMSEGIEALRGEVTVARNCDDLLETIALAESGLADAVLLAGPSPDIDAATIDALHERGAAVVVLVDDAEESTRIRGYGASCASALTSPQAVADLLELTARQASRPA